MKGIFSIWQNFESTLAKTFAIAIVVNGKILKNNRHLVTLVRSKDYLMKLYRKEQKLNNRDLESNPITKISCLKLRYAHFTLSDWFEKIELPIRIQL